MSTKGYDVWHILDKARKTYRVSDGWLTILSPKPWLRTVDGLGWLMAASLGLRVQTRKLTAAS